MVRLSSYTNFSKEIQQDHRVIMNGISGALDIVPPLLAEYLEKVLLHAPQGQAHIDPDILDPPTVQSFIERGHFTDLTHNQEKNLVAEIARGLHEVEKKRPCFMIAPNMDCNYRCTYCFERAIQNRLQDFDSPFSYRKNNVVMQPDQIQLIFDCIDRIQTEIGAHKNAMITLYGGEPLDARHHDLVTGLVRYGADRGFWFSAVTNGHDLDAYDDILSKEMVQQVQITFDGPRKTHDRHRIYRGKGQSFDKLTSNVNGIIEKKDVELHLRVHVDPANFNLFGEFLDFAREQGWTNHPQITIYANVLYDKDGCGRVCARGRHDDMARQLDQYAGYYFNVFTSALAVHIYHGLQPVFESGKRYALRGTYCSANLGNFIFTPTGDIHACWESIGKKESRIGTFSGTNGLQLDRRQMAEWFNRNIAEIDECLECSLALVCGGGCAQYAKYNAGAFNQPFCDSFSETFSIALADEVTRRINVDNMDLS